MKLVFIIDPIENLDPTHDSSVALMEAAQMMGNQAWITQAKQLTVIEGKAWATVTPITLEPVTLGSDRWVAVDQWFSLGEPTLLPLEEFDAVWLRTDPPVTTAYLYATYLLDYVDPAKTLVLNSMAGIRAANEKMYALQFGAVIPETIVSQDKAVIREFVERRDKAVMKPLGGMGGEGILFLRSGDPNFNSMVDISTHKGTLPVMVQQFLPEEANGDKRVILIDGEPVGAVNRIPTGSDFRGNMAVGGRVAQVDVTDRDREIAQLLAPQLKKDGLYFVGIDVIGGYLTEVNVTSPTGIREIDRLDGVSIGKQAIAWIESQRQ
ncbi:MAG: glutathione synthase [Cyanobacteria bacterium P01_D01_bin.73]